MNLSCWSNWKMSTTTHQHQASYLCRLTFAFVSFQSTVGAPTAQLSLLHACESELLCEIAACKWCTDRATGVDDEKKKQKTKHFLKTHLQFVVAALAFDAIGSFIPNRQMRHLINMQNMNEVDIYTFRQKFFSWD